MMHGVGAYYYVSFTIFVFYFFCSFGAIFNFITSETLYKISELTFTSVFIGAVDPAKSNYNLETAEPFLAKAGSISLHHVRSLHGSKKNNSDKSRRVLFIGYTAADSWPLKGILDLGLKPTTSEGDFVKDIYNVYTSNIVRGKPCLEARIESNPIKMPYPPPKSVGSIYENQKEVRGRSFGE